MTELRLPNIGLSGPIPDLSALANLAELDLRGNLLCLPADVVLPAPNEAVNAHLQGLNLPPCPDP